LPKIFAISDLHLPGSTGKTMDVFGPAWVDHDRKIETNWRRLVTDEDLVLIPGDISWAMRLPEAEEDLRRIGAWPGTKVMIRGNHDYWWQGIGKVRQKLHPSVHALQNDAVFLHGWAICGTRGWKVPGGEDFTEEDEKIYRREVQRLELSLQAAGGQEPVIAMLHYPPFNEKGEPSLFVELMHRYGVRICVYGHLHGPHLAEAVTGNIDGIEYHLVSCDHVDFAPLLVKEIK